MSGNFEEKKTEKKSVQFEQSSPAKNGGAYFSAKKFDLTTVLKSH